MMAEFKKATLFLSTKCSAIYETEWSKVGFEGRLSGGRIQERRAGATSARFHQAVLEQPSLVLELEKDVRATGRKQRHSERPHDQVNSLGRSEVEIVDYKNGQAKKRLGRTEKTCN